MKIQRKLLSIEQKLGICNPLQNCDGCPLRFKALGFNLCESDVKELEIAIKHYWDEEVEVKDEIFSNNSGT